jgi:putative ATP-dependent endonuclease of OLD family
MRLIQLRLQNFRCYQSEITIDLDQLVVFIGKNDAGKSTILDALQAFFNGAPDADDATVSSADKQVRITCVFDRLPHELVIDEQRPTDLASEYLLNREGHLEVIKCFNCGVAGKVRAGNIYVRALHPTAEKYGDLLSLTNSKLKQRAKDVGADLSAVNQGVNTELRRAIWATAPTLNMAEVELELKGETIEKVWDKLKACLPVYAHFKSDRPSTDQDEEAQDPMKSAIKEAIRAQEGRLSEIAELVKREVQGIADDTVQKIREMDPDLASQLTPRVSNKSWDSIFSVSLTGDENIPINKRGSGTRRLVLLNFFRARAEREALERGAGVIYGIEEPETSQHPGNQKMLVAAFEDLSAAPGCQVLLTTHTPVLARRFERRLLRFVTRENGEVRVLKGEDDEALRKIKESLGVLPDHDIRVFVGVEGRHDISFLTCMSHILNHSGEPYPDLGVAEASGQLVFIPMGGSNMDLWISRLDKIDLPEFYLMDRDSAPPAEPKYAKCAKDIAKRPGTMVWTTNRKELENYLHPDVIKAVCPSYAGTGDAFEDVPLLFARAVHEAAQSAAAWADVVADAEKLGKKLSNAKRRLNREVAAAMTPQLLSCIDKDNEIRTWLCKIGEALGRDSTPSRTRRGSRHEEGSGDMADPPGDRMAREKESVKQSGKKQQREFWDYQS